jgi:uncharacterized protein YdaL
MNVIETSKNGIVNKETIFHFEQNANTVKANYSGGRIREGYLVGQLNDEILKFTYCQQRITGELDHGESECILSIEKGSGKVKLKENFKMDTEVSKEVGINIFMEI